ncbi:MAG TPA: hypothetical protein VHU84_14025 [Lacipirellulaceae bacterium]|nr:hypothetical protein [Lacipirellulaceae bacterium]
MASLFGILLAAVVSTSGVEGQPVADKKPAASPTALAEHSMMKQAMERVSALANVITPIPTTNPSGDKTAEPAPAGVVWVHLSKGYLADYVERNVDHNKPARQDVLGIVFTGDSRTIGKTRLILRPDDREAAAEVEFTGTVRSHTIGHSGPATLQYLSESNFHARKQLVIGENGVSTSTAVVDAPTHLTPTSIETSLPGLRGRIGDRIARRREAGSRSQAEVIVGRNTAGDIRHDFDATLNNAVAQIQSKVQTQIAALKVDGKDGCTVMRSRSTPEFVEVALCPQGSTSEHLQMASASPIEGNPDFAVRVHRSVMASLLRDSQLRNSLTPLLGSIVTQGVGTHSDTKTPTCSMRGDWFAIDLTGAADHEAPHRLAAAEALTNH